mgnify:CR=1 FL=1|jgi:hypothetical protein
MKPIVIIAIAVVCSVGAVLGVLITLQGIATYQSQVALEKYYEEEDRKQMIIVNAYNTEMGKCQTVFEYGNISAKTQCEENARKYFDIWQLDDQHTQKLKRAFDSKEHSMYLSIISKNLGNDSQITDFAGCIYDAKQGGQYYIDRYDKEKTYREWFDERFSALAITEAVDFAESQNIDEAPWLTNAEYYSTECGD